MDQIVALSDWLQVLEASGGVGIWVLAWFVWRFDRRLLRLEFLSQRLSCPLREQQSCGFADHEQADFPDFPQDLEETDQ